MYRLFFVVFVTSVAANSCPEVLPVENFNITSYGQGIWYEVARYTNASENIEDCVSAELKLEGDAIKVKKTYVVNKKAVHIEGVAKLPADAGKSGKVIQSLPNEADGASTNNVLNILAIDYDKYVITYLCKFDEATKQRQELAWILSRSKTLPDDAKAAVDKYLKESKILNAEKFTWPKFTEEACKADA